jgi:hypothetical protein
MTTMITTMITTIIPLVAAMPCRLAKEAHLLSPRRCRKRFNVGSELALDKLHDENKMNNLLQDQFFYNSFHGENDNTNSIGLVETNISGKGTVKNMYYSQEPEVIRQNMLTKSTASSLQMKDRHPRPWKSLQCWNPCHNGNAA